MNEREGATGSLGALFHFRFPYSTIPPLQVYRLSDQKAELIYAPPSQPISPSVTICFATWRWDQLIR
ncbi:MAG: hypothetical protein C4294_19100, partial [Nitrospiraceae bacterium]